MSDPQVIVLPGAIGPDRAAAIAALTAATGNGVVRDVDLPIPDRAPLSTRTCAAIRTLGLDGEVIVVAPTASTGIVPAVALALRAAHLPVIGYVLIAPDDDPTGADWPDAPVVVIADADSPAAQRARLRGWQRVAPGPADLASAVRCLAD